MGDAKTLASVTVELKGHLIDSLTLAKVIDLTQSLGGEYHLNHLSIGSQKNQLSSVNLTITAESEEIVQAILAQLQPYGAQTVSTQSAALTEMTQSALLPAGAALSLHFPKRVCVDGAWLPIENANESFAVVVDPTSRSACVKTLSEILPGERLVVGSHGLDWSASR